MTFESIPLQRGHFITPPEHVVAANSNTTYR
jgi:hypothetical protein